MIRRLRQIIAQRRLQADVARRKALVGDPYAKRRAAQKQSRAA